MAIMKESLFNHIDSKEISSTYDDKVKATIYLGDRLELLSQIPDKSAQLIVTSPPYNIGKEYEKRRDLNVYLAEQKETIAACVEKLSDNGSLCWQVGNHVDKGEIFPLDALIYPICKELGLKLRNRIVWHFGHGLHATKRFSGRYETIIWFTKSDNYYFNLDPVRVPQKYPSKKNYKGDKKGTYSCNPLGKNPSDIWEIPNVKSNHVEKTCHPCQFPVELIERLVLSMTKKDDLVIDPYMGVGTALAAAVKHGRRAAGADVVEEYVNVAKQRVKQALEGLLKTRPMGTPVYSAEQSNLSKTPEEFIEVRFQNGFALDQAEHR